MIIQIIIALLGLYELMILGRVLMGWARMSPYDNEVARFLFDATEPVLRPIREFLPQAGMFDFSPIVVFLIISMIIQMLSSF